MSILKVCLCAAVFVGSLFLNANPASMGSEINVTMSVYTDRKLIIFNFVNTTATSYEGYIAPGNDNNLMVPKAMSIALPARQSVTAQVSFGDMPRLDQIAILDFEISYGVSGKGFPFKVFNPIQYFGKGTSGWRPTTALAQNVVNQKFVKTNRVEPVEPARIDFGGNLTVTSSLSHRDFPVEFNLNIKPGVVPVRAPLATDLANRLPFKSLPRSKGPILGAKFIENNNSKIFNLDFMNEGYFQCGSLVLCLTGELQVLNSFKEGVIPGWGWSVEVWDIQSIPWKMFAKTETDWQGKWGIPVGYQNGFVGVPPNHKYYIVYRTANRYIEVRDPITQKAYSWGFETSNYDTLKSFIMPNKSIVGVGRVFGYANSLWQKLVANDINPIAEVQNIIYFPNVLDSQGKSPCTFGDGKPKNPIIAWTCTYGSTIYMIPDHANQFTVVHELAHNLHKLFWGSFPAGSGGDHRLGMCYNKGLAVTEGFANFLPIWADGKMNTDYFKNGDGYFKTCAMNGNSDELSVASTFWDLTDTVYDQRIKADKTTVYDQLYYEKSADIIVDFLNNKDVKGMSEFKIKLQKYYTTVSEYIEKLFDLNDTANE